MIEVSIIIPCCNEENHIRKCLDSLIAGTFPQECLEILVVDGGSTDSTKAIVKDYAKKYNCIRLLENPNKFTVFAFNIGIRNISKTVEYITMLNAHGSYSPDRIKTSIDFINEYDVDAVGGRSKAISRQNTLVGNAISFALSSTFGSGNSFRVEQSKPKLTDTASGTLYKKDIFESIGLFNENLIYSQDMEFNQRVKAAGYKILLVPDLVTNYYARSNYFQFCRHNFRNGLWVILPFGFTVGMPVAMRHIIPLLFSLSLLVSGFLSIFSEYSRLAFLVIILSYFCTSMFYSCKIALAQKKATLLYVMPFVFFSLHFSYGIGSIWGLAKLLFLPRNTRKEVSR